MPRIIMLKVAMFFSNKKYVNFLFWNVGLTKNGMTCKTIGVSGSSIVASTSLWQGGVGVGGSFGLVIGAVEGTTFSF